MTLDAEAMHLAIEAIQTVGNNAEAIKDYLTALNPNNLQAGYFGDYYFNAERTVEGLGFLIYAFQDGNLIAI
jgi:hypothetical protein